MTRVWTHHHLRIFSLAILGLIVGSLGGFWLGRAILLRTVKVGLTVYAQDLSRNSDSLSDEVNSIFFKMNAPAGPLCSNQDVAEMRALTFRAVHIKDIGRTHDGKLYCSAFLGCLAHPHAEGPASLVLAGGANVYTHVAVVMDSSGGGNATVVEAGGISVALNSNAFGAWNRPNVRYMVVAFNRERGRVTQIAGSALEIEPAWVLSQDSQIAHGSIYRKACSTRHAVCVVTEEHLADVWRSTLSTQIAYLAMGGFAGLSFALLLALLLWRASSLGYQLLRAVRRNSPSLHLVYQPILDVRTERCLGAEALLRWKDQDGVSVPPDVFIPIAEKGGFINEVTTYVLRHAAEDLAHLLRDNADFTLSINVAASDLVDDGLLELLKSQVKASGIRSGQIALELTERSTADLTSVRAAIQRLKAEGYKIHIDDFGIGFSSLSYIDQLQVNAIKIDRAFTRTIGTDAMIAPILSQMVEMADSLGLEIVVEGVETEAQRDCLAASDKHLYAQGWYYSKPLTAEALGLFQSRNKASQEPVLNTHIGCAPSPQEFAASALSISLK